MTAITSTSAAQSTATRAPAKTGFGALGSADFIKLMTTQLQQQDPFQPVDNKEMLAQMAQFSSLSGINDVNTTLKAISSKLDAVLTAQTAAANLAAASTAQASATSASTTATAA
jgi:flagellar basal-body rod modification protein FlgD